MAGRIAPARRPRRRPCDAVEIQGRGGRRRHRLGGQLQRAPARLRRGGSKADRAGRQRARRRAQVRAGDGARARRGRHRGRMQPARPGEGGSRAGAGEGTAAGHRAGLLRRGRLLHRLLTGEDHTHVHAIS
jgi:hypothetical protein